MKKVNHEGYFGLILAAIAVLVLWLLNKKGLLHESVTAGIITPQGTITSSVEGYPQFDATNTATYDPQKYALSVAPIDTNGQITNQPRNRTGATCPIGYSKWVDVVDNSIWCMPD